MAEDPNVPLLRDPRGLGSRGLLTRNDMFDPEVEFVTDLPERRSYYGYEGARLAWFDFLSAWRDFTVEAEKILPAPGDRYLIFVRLRGSGRGSQARTEGAAANLATLRDGRIVRFQLFFDPREEALVQAGLERAG